MKPEYRKKQILAAAKKVFAAKGYHNTNIEMICNKAGTARGTIYRYFKNKEGIFAAILEDSLAESTRRMKEGFDITVSSLNTREAMVQAYTETAERVLMLWLEDRDFARINLEASTAVNRQFSEIRREHERRSIALIKTMLDEWKQNPLVRQDLDTELVAIRMRGSLEKITTVYLVDRKKKPKPDEIRRLARKNAEIDLFGMLVPGTSKT
jgi:AcrR family transcriptional regulator